MSIFVTIMHDPPGDKRPAFSRGLRISRMSYVFNNHVTADMVLTYEAKYFQTANERSKLLGVAMFEHRYGDPLHVLVTEALQAIQKVEPPIDPPVAIG